VIYEHTATSAVAQRLAGELKTMLADMRQQGVKVYDGETAIVLRAIEQGARDARKGGTSDTAYLALMGRLLQNVRSPETDQAEAKASSLILP
jgi:hypothetical protein